MLHTNAWSNPSNAGPGEAAQMAAFLERRSQCPDIRQTNIELIRILNPAPGERILEAGCGTGVLCRMVSPALLPGGQVTGLDRSVDFLSIARQTICRESINGDKFGNSIHFVNAEAERMPFPSGSFDAAFAARLLLHTQDPQTIVVEMARVVKPGGSVILMDWDFDTVAVDPPDRELTRRLLHWRSDHHGGENWSGRRLWRYSIIAGLVQPTVVPVVTVAHSESDGLTQSLWRAAQVAREAGAISPEEHDRWVADLKLQIEQGYFFASIVYFIVRGFVRHD
jgi:ubiquinone/menaquinone biosynthesis C-methylase UbiE